MLVASFLNMNGRAIPAERKFQMKSVLTALLLLGLSLVGGPAFAADSRNVSVINETG
jgi:hypothetical protein